MKAEARFARLPAYPHTERYHYTVGYERDMSKSGTVTKRRAGGQTKFDPIMIPIIKNLCLQGKTDVEIAEILGISEPTLYRWKAAHAEVAKVLNESKVCADQKVKQAMFKRAIGFERKVQKATASGKVVTVTEYFPPDVNAQTRWLQARDPEFKPSQEHKHVLSADEAFLRFLEHVEDAGHQERKQLKQIELRVEDAQVVQDENEG